MLDRPDALAYPDPPLSDEAVGLRPWTHGDLPCVKAATEDPRIPEGTTLPPIYSPDEGRAWVERQWERRDSGEGISLALVDSETDCAVGAVVVLLRPQPGTAGIGYWLLHHVRGRGLASRAVDLTSRWALTDGGLARVEALVEVDNTASQRLLERVGFHREGHLRSYLILRGRRVDAFIYSLLSSDLGARGSPADQPSVA